MRHGQGQAGAGGGAAVFEALSSPARLELYLRLLRSGEAGLDAPALARELRTTGSALTLHLRRLADAGLVSAQGRGGRFVAATEPLSAVVRAIELERGAPD